MNKIISKNNENLSNKISSLMITVYNGAKQLTLSAKSWLSRVIANQKANRFQYILVSGRRRVRYTKYSTQSQVRVRSRRLSRSLEWGQSARPIGRALWPPLQ